jgi:hypothetical protein
MPKGRPARESGSPALTDAGRERPGDEGPVMLSQSIKTELRRLTLHPVNLDLVSEIDGNVVLKGSLVGIWQVPKSIDGQWFLEVLKDLPDLAGPKSTMDAYYEAYTADDATKVQARSCDRG